MSAAETSRQIQVIAPSRLHFGLLSFGRPDRRQYGGVGVMVQQPAVHLELTPCPKFEVSGPLATRVTAFARHWQQWHEQTRLPGCRVTVKSIAREHVGLGVGTQLGLAVATGLNHWQHRSDTTIVDLACSVGRGLRSAIGSHGFCSGGLIVDAGKAADEDISPLQVRVELPPQWQFVLVSPRQGVGLSGERETTAFGQLDPVPEEVSQRLQDEIDQEIVPAAQQGQFGEFSRAVFRFGELAGSCFATVQGGAYHGPELIQRVAWMRSLGIEGVGQSSWGPTLFALFPDPTAAAAFVQQARQDPQGCELEYEVTCADNHGARVIDHSS